MRNPRKEVGRNFNELVDYSQIINTPGGGGSGTVTSVAMTVPTGLTVTGSPITTAGTLAVSLTAGYLIPTTASKTDWDAAYNDKIVSAAVTGTTTKTLTLTQQDAGTITASWTDATGSGTVTSVAMTVPTGLTISGTPITTSGTLALTLTAGYSIPTTSSQTTWDTAYTNRITSLTVTGSSGSSTLVSNVLNIPTYTLTGLGGQPLATNLTSLAALTFASTSFVKMTAAGTFALDTTVYTSNTGTVTSVAMTVPTGLSIAGSPITTSGTLALTLTAGYSIPTTASQTTWDTAYTNRITSLTVTGSSGSATLVSNVLNIPTYTLAGLGGLANPMTTLGDSIYGGASGAATRLAGNITTAKQYLSQTGTGTVSAAPVWATIAGADITGAALTKVDDTNVTITLGGTPTTALLRAASITLGWTGTLADARITSAATWNAKQSAITLTTTGSSGASTFVTNTLNIPTYTLAGLGGVPYTGATASVDLGTFNLTANLLNNKGVVVHTSTGISTGTSNAVNLQTGASQAISGAGYVSLLSSTADYFSIYYGGSTKVANFVGSSLTAARTYTLPNATGTIALTSDILFTSLTTTGSSGAATLTSGVLNIPQYNNIYSSDGTLAGARTVTQGANNITFTGSRTSGTAFQITSLQTTPNSTDTGDIALGVSYTLTASSATSQLVTRAFSYSAVNNLTGGGVVTNFRIVDIGVQTNTGTTATDNDIIYILGNALASGTVTNQRGVLVRGMQGTNRAAFVGDAIGGTASTYLLIGTRTIPTGLWGIYQSEATFNNYFNGKVLLGTTTASTYELDVVGDIRGSTYTALAGTATTTPLTLTLASAVLNTTAVAGAYEVDTIGIPYYSYAASSRGVNVNAQFINLSTTYTLTSQTAAQKMFNTSTNGALTVQAATTYIFECDFSVGAMSATSGTFGFAIGGTATITSIQWISQAGKSATPTTPFGLENTFNTTAANTTLTTASNVTQGAARIQGIIRINAAGTIIPSISLTVAAAAVVGANSRFSLYPIGTNTVTKTGNWS